MLPSSRGWHSSRAGSASTACARPPASGRQRRRSSSTVEAEDKLALLDEALTVHEALAAVPEHCREVLDRFFARDESYKTIGEALDLPSGTIASRISRCLARLKSISREEKTGRPVWRSMTAYQEERLAQLIRALPPAPESWVRAAQELPFARGEYDDIVAGPS